MVSTGFYTQGSSRSGQNRIGAAIQQASAQTGVDFGYLFNQAKIESGLNPSVRARTSSATGLFQFIDQTWLATVNKHGAGHGLGWAADAIQRGSDGRYRVADAGVRQAILELRKNPEAASAMAAEFASDNKAVLENTLERPAEPVDLYLAHFLGAGGASTFLRAHDADPGAPAARLLPEAARANRAIFFDRDGSPRSLGEIRDRFAAKLGGSPTPPRARGLGDGEFIPLRMAALQTGDARFTGPRPSPEYARLAYLMLAEIGG
jgi:hypothetical protein